MAKRAVKIQYKEDVGSVVRGLLNGVKHTSQTIGPVIGVEPEKLEKIIEGKTELTKDIEEALASFTGINQKDFYPAEIQHLFPVVDDTDDGVVIFRAQDTSNSRRTLTRGPDDTPFYIYADTAMSNVSTFRPEWIKELYVHGGENADDLPDWAFNKGHFEHQVTYFVGPVNFYWTDRGGKRHVRKMSTGDTNYIVPFVPHTFTTRKEGEGLILAVTYGGAISNAEFRSKIGALNIEDYLKNTKEKLPNPLPVTDKNMSDGVDILKYCDAGGEKVRETQYSPHNVINLIHSDCQPDTKVKELIVKLDGGDNARDSISSDRWGYNIGNSGILLKWGKGKECQLKPGDSFFIKPETIHAFAPAKAGQDGRLLVIDIKPQQGDPYAELAVIERYAGDAGLKRIHTETTRWY